MIETRPPRIVPLRYSPKPIEAYTRPVKNAPGTLCGPATSAFLRDDIACWNLAFLSHDYDARAEAHDPNFTVLVWKTVQTVISTGRLQRISRSDVDGKLVRDLLELPADQFLQAIDTEILHMGRVVQLYWTLPLYAEYGEAWMDRMRERAPLCLRAPVATEHQPGDEVADVSAARSELARIMAKK